MEYFLDKCTLCLLLILLSAGKRKPSSCLHSECLKTKTLKKQWNFHATTVRTRLNAWNEWRSTLFDSPSTQSAQPAPLEKDHSMKAFLDLPWFVHLWFVQLRFDQLWFVQLWFVQVMVGIKCIACSPLGQTFCGSRTCSRCCYPPLGQTNTSQLHSSLAGLLFPGYKARLLSLSAISSKKKIESWGSVDPPS